MEMNDPQVFQDSIRAVIQAQIESYSVPKSKVLGGYIQHSRSCVRQYNGRQIFEMLQNMDDQMAEHSLTDSDRCSEIVFDKERKYLVFRNRGIPFSAAGIESIMFPDVSPKRRHNSTPTIGNKGLGFRSLLNWNPKAIVIRSNGTELTFSDEGVRSYVEKEENNCLKEALAATGEEKLPMLSFPLIDDWKGMTENWSTEIELQHLDKFESEIEKELREFDSELMLFLPNLRQVDIRIISSDKISSLRYQASKREPILEESLHIQKRTIRKANDDGSIISFEWLVCWERGQLTDENNESLEYNIEIAVPQNATQRQNLSRVLYNYLPVSGVHIDLPCLIHATVNLGDNRNELLVRNKPNMVIFTEKLPQRLIHFSKVIRDQFRYGKSLVDDRWLPFKLLNAPMGNFDKYYITPFYALLRKTVETEAFCPCVDGEFRCPNECCYYPPRNEDGCDITGFFNKYPVFVPFYVLSGAPPSFALKSANVDDFRKTLNHALEGDSDNNCRYADDVLIELLYILWRIAKREFWEESGPYWLFHDKAGKILDDSKINVYTPPVSADTLRFPNYMNADFIDGDLWNALCRRFDTEVKLDTRGNKDFRAFCNNELHRFLRVEYYDRATAAKKIISSAIRVLKDNNSVEEKREIIADLINSLRKNYSPDEKPREENIPLFVCADGEIKYANDFLFESAKTFYGNSLPTDVFLSDVQIATIIMGENSSRLKQFLRYLGVRNDVRVRYVTISDVHNPYFTYLQEKGEDAGGLPRPSQWSNALEEPLKLPTLRDDKQLRNLPAQSFFSLFGQESIDDLTKLLSDSVRVSWKAIHGKYYYPKDVKWSYAAFQLADMFKNVIYGENDKVLADLGWRYEQSRKDIPLEIIKKLGAKSHFSDLSIDELFGLLKTVADRNIRPTKDFYKKINAAFVIHRDNGETVSPPSDLKVFATWGGNCEGYCPAGEVYYHDNPAHARELAKGRKMFFLGARIGVDNVCRHFGVKKLDETKAEIKERICVEDDLQAAFEADFKRKSPVLGVILNLHRSTNIDECNSRIAGVHIQLVSSLIYSYDKGMDNTLARFDYIRDRNEDSGVFYLCVGGMHDLSELGNTDLRRFSRSLAGILCDFVKLSDEELERQFEGCFFDLDTAEADLKDSGYTVDMSLEILPNYYQKHWSTLQNISNTVWSQFIKPFIWNYMNNGAHNGLQKYYRSCELSYRLFIQKALNKGGILEAICSDRQNEDILDNDLRSTVVEVIKENKWLPQGCRQLQDELRNLELNTPDSWVESSFHDLYPQFDKYVEEDLDDEVLSLMSFSGNEDRISLLLKTCIEENETDKMESEAELEMLEVKEGTISFSSPNIAVEGLVRGGSGQAMTQRRQKDMKRRGNLAENLVINWLKKRPVEEGISNIENKSGSAHNSGRNDSLHYDISYIKGGETYYVEVKVADSGEFHITAGELEFARKNSKYYILALVFLDEETKKIKLVDDVYEKLKEVKVAEAWRVAIETCV